MSKAFCTFHGFATCKQVGHSSNLFSWVLKGLSKFKLGVCQPYDSQGLLLCRAEAGTKAAEVSSQERFQQLVSGVHRQANRQEMWCLLHTAQ